MILTSVRLLHADGAWDVELLPSGRIGRLAPAGTLAGTLTGGLTATSGPPPAPAPTLDAGGRWLLPGFWDEHTHFRVWAETSRRLDVGPAASAADATRLIAAAVTPGETPSAGRPSVAAPSSGAPSGTATHPDATPSEREAGPVVAAGFRDALWPDAPHRDLLDAALPGREVYVVSADLHSIWLSSAALARHGHADHPTGLLREADCFAVTAALATVPAAVGDAWAREAADRAAARGVTGIVDFDLSDRTVADWARRAAGGFTTLRVEAGIYADALEAAIAAGQRTGDPIGPDGLIRIGHLKVIADGSLGTRTAWCRDPYPGLTGPDACGLPAYDTGQLTALLRRGWAHGLVPAVHAIGDRAVSQVLDALAAARPAAVADAAGVVQRTHAAAGLPQPDAARAARPARAPRPARVEHAQLMTAADAARLARLGLVASVQPEHAMDDRDIAERHWPGRTARAFPLRDLLDAGAVLAFGSDAPVAPLDPWAAISAAVAKTRDERAPWHPEQGVTIEEALAASARGRLAVRPGDPADLQLVEANPLTATPAALRHMRVAATFTAGRPVHLAL